MTDLPSVDPGYTSDDGLDKPFGINLTDIESIAAAQRMDVPEFGICATCGKQMFRLVDYMERTLVWNHKSSGRPASYSPDLHDAQPPFPAVAHSHNWVELASYSRCDVEGCGARKLPPSTPMGKGMFMPNVKDKQMAESRARGARRGGDTQRAARHAAAQGLD